MRHPATNTISVKRVNGLIEQTETAEVAEECAIALIYNDVSHAVMMASPIDLEDFALGFSLTEGIIDHADELHIVQIEACTNGIVINMLIPQIRLDTLLKSSRNISGRTGCGLCGAATLEAAIRPTRIVSVLANFSRIDIPNALSQLAQGQIHNRGTGSLHAAAILCGENDILVREDVGRHNAIDKAIGAISRLKQPPIAMLVTSRASYEVVHKAAQVNCPIVVAISAPTALAIRIAKIARITLVGFARANTMTIYNSP